MTADEIAFEQLILGGAPFGGLMTAAGNLVTAGSTTPMGDMLRAMLDMQPGSTFEQGAARVQTRVANGLAPF